MGRSSSTVVTRRDATQRAWNESGLRNFLGRLRRAWSGSSATVPEHLRGRDVSGLESGEARGPGSRSRSHRIQSAVKRFHEACQDGTPPQLDSFCAPYRQLGSRFYSSVYRQLEVEAYLADHPHVLDGAESIRWPEIGDTFAKLVIEEELGRGALGRVYLCRQPALGGRQVVVKVSLLRSAEAQTMARLGHSHIVPVHYVANDETEDVDCMIMPFLGRSTLDDILDVAFSRGVPKESHCMFRAARCWMRPTDEVHEEAGGDGATRLPRDYVDAVLQIIVQICDAVAFAHDAGVIHGDLKPSNILITPGCKPLLLDFNLSHDARADLKLRGGTIPYMAPEQILALAAMAGAPSKLGSVGSDEPLYDWRTDIYALGALLYELLTGSTPYNAPRSERLDTDSAKRLIAERHLPTTPAYVRNPAVGAELHGVIARCLAADPSDRFDSVRELANALRHQQRWAARVRRVFARNRRASYLATAAVSGLIACTVAHEATRSPTHVRRYEQAVTAVRNQQPQQAERQLAEVIALQPGFIKARYLYAQLEMRRHRFDEVIAQRNYIKDALRYPRLDALIGWALQEKGAPAAAVTYYEKALADGLRTAGVWNNLGFCRAFAKQGEAPGHAVEDLVAGLGCWQQALTINPDLEAAHVNILQANAAGAELGASLGVPLALRSAAWLLARFPDHPEVVVWAYRLHLRPGGDQDKAVQLMRRAYQAGYGPLPYQLREFSARYQLDQHPDFYALWEQAGRQEVATYEAEPLLRTVDPRYDHELTPDASYDF